MGNPTDNDHHASELERQSAEKGRVHAEDRREYAEDTREDAEDTREDAEDTREDAEDTREDAEASRKAAEQLRQTMEELRQITEQLRESAEAQRAAAEILRVELGNIHQAREQTAYLWKVIDQLHTAAQDVRQGNTNANILADYVMRKTIEARQTVPFPGEPPKRISEDDTRPPDESNE